MKNLPSELGPLFYTAWRGKQTKMPGPSYSKFRKLNKLVSGQNVNCSSKYNSSSKSYSHFFQQKY